MRLRSLRPPRLVEAFLPVFLIGCIFVGTPPSVLLSKARLKTFAFVERGTRFAALSFMFGPGDVPGPTSDAGA